MDKLRQSNFELLRILLMIAVPLYHMMIYAGIIYMPYGKLTPAALLICSGSAIVADYAFMAMSAFFFLSSKGKTIIQRFLELGMQVAILYFFKIFMLRQVLNFPKEDYYVNDFFVKGAWWFVYVYMIILLIYPVLNYMIYRLKLNHLRMLCMLLGICFIWNGIQNDVNLFHDLIAFLFTYFVVGYLKRSDFKTYFGIKNRKSMMLAIYMIGVFMTFAFLSWVKYPGNLPSDEIASDIVRVVVGKYSFPQFVMGVAVFLLFQSISIKTNKYINAFAQNVFCVFLLHETVMAIYWYFGKMRTIDDRIPYDNLFDLVVWAFIYIISSFLFAGVIRIVYESLIGRYIRKSIEIFCNTKIVKKIEFGYRKFEV